MPTKKYKYGYIGKTGSVVGQTPPLDVETEKKYSTMADRPITGGFTPYAPPTSRVQSFEEVMASSRALQERIKTEGLTLSAPAPTIKADDLTTQIAPVDLPVLGDTDIPTVAPPVAPPTEPPITEPPPTDTSDYLKTYLEGLELPVDPTAAYKEAREEAEIPEKQEAFIETQRTIKAAQSELQMINAQIADIVGQTQVRKLEIAKEPISAGAIRGRNIVEERNLAIRAIPLQAQALVAQANIASAQGDEIIAQNALSMAQDSLDKVFGMQLDYSENLRTFNNNLRAAVFEYADKSQQRQLEQQEVEDERRYEEQRDQIDYAQSIAKDLLQTQPNLAAKIAQIDFSKPNATQKLSNLMGQVEPEALIGDVPDIIAAGGKITPDQLSPLAYSIYAGTIKLTDITPSQRAEIAPELTAVGYTAMIGSEMKQAVSYIKNQMPNVLEKWRAIPNNLKGVVQGWLAEKAGVGLWNAKVSEFNAAAKIVGMQLTRLYEKGRISDQDRIFYLSIMPNIRMNEEAAKAGSDELIRLLEEKLVSQINELEQPIGAEGDGLSDEEAWALYNKMNQ